MNCFYFGYDGGGHALCYPGLFPVDKRTRLGVEWCNNHHIDGSLAPRRRHSDDSLCWNAQVSDQKTAGKLEYNSGECPQGQFLLHHLKNGYTAIAWWDRTQGDTRPGSNSVILLEGEYTTEEMLDALKTHFPGVLDNLIKAGITLMDVTP